MARKPKNANIDIGQTARVFNEQTFVDGVFNDDNILVVGSGVILDRKQFPNSGSKVNQYIFDYNITTTIKFKRYEQQF